MDELIALDEIDGAVDFSDEYDLEMLDLGEYEDGDPMTYSDAVAKAAA